MNIWKSFCPFAAIVLVDRVTCCFEPSKFAKLKTEQLQKIRYKFNPQQQTIQILNEFCFSIFQILSVKLIFFIFQIFRQIVASHNYPWTQNCISKWLQINCIHQFWHGSCHQLFTFGSSHLCLQRYEGCWFCPFGSRNQEKPGMDCLFSFCNRYEAYAF